MGWRAARNLLALSQFRRVSGVTPISFAVWFIVKYFLAGSMLFILKSKSPAVERKVVYKLWIIY